MPGRGLPCWANDDGGPDPSEPSLRVFSLPSFVVGILSIGIFYLPAAGSMLGAAISTSPSEGAP
jgi:hypothetical protein